MTVTNKSLQMRQKKPIRLTPIIQWVFSSKDNIPNIQGENIGDPFTTDIKKIRKRIKAIGKNKSVGPDQVSGEILKLEGEAMIPYLARLLDITIMVLCCVTEGGPRWFLFTRAVIDH